MKGLTVNHEQIVAELKPIFYGDVEEINTFLQDIQYMKPTQITERVNQLVKQDIISGLSRKRNLWSVLHRYELYLPSETNWNLQVK